MLIIHPLFRNFTPIGPYPPSNGTKPAWDAGWVLRNYEANKNYYNPNVTYEPWAGTKVNGDPMYDNADPSKAWKDPNRTTASDESIDLTINRTFSEGSFTTNTMWIPTYYEWVDDDGDGVVEQTDSRRSQN